MEAILGIIIAALLSENFILVKFYGICPFMGVSKKIDTALGMGMAVTFVMALASAACYAVNLLLVGLNLQYMQTVAFILVIASIVQVVEMFLNESHSLHITQIQGHQHKFVNQPAGRGGQGHDEGDRHTHTQGGIDLLGNAHEGADAVEFHQDEVFAQQSGDDDTQDRFHYFAASFFLFLLSSQAMSHWEPAITKPSTKKPPTGITSCMAG